MDGQRFDDLTRALAHGASRRAVLKGLVSSVVGGGAALLGRSGAGAIPQAACGNTICAADPSVCNDGCVCCVFSNGNSRCMAPDSCERLRGELVCPDGQPACDGACAACPTSTDPCQVAACLDGACGFVPNTDGTPCGDDNPCNQTGTCQGGVCVSGNPVEEGGACIGQEGFCLNHTCVEACDRTGGACAGLSPCGSSGSGCDCFATPEGTTACVGQPRSCAGPTCDHSSDCPEGSVCLLSCCGTGVCRPLCGEAQVSLAAFDDVGGSMFLP